MSLQLTNMAQFRTLTLIRDLVGCQVVYLSNMMYLLLRSPLTRGRKISQHRIRGEKGLGARHTGSDLSTQQEIQNVCKVMQKFLQTLLGSW
jgi:hypothetical protein